MKDKGTILINIRPSKLALHISLLCSCFASAAVLADPSTSVASATSVIIPSTAEADTRANNSLSAANYDVTLAYANTTRQSDFDLANFSGDASGSSATTQKNWWGATAELSILMVMGELLYKVGEDSMEVDQDYELSGNEAKYFWNRLTDEEYWKYDDNDIGMNWGHAYAGALYYQAFRNNGFNYYESSLGTLFSSTFWEVVAEYKEVVSINDQIVTTWGGMVLGEGLFQFSEMLATKDGWIPTTLSWAFNPGQMVFGWFDAASPARFNRSKVKDEFNLYTGVRYSDKQQADVTSTMMTFGMEASVDSRAGHYDNFSSTPTWVEMQMETGISQEGVEDWQMTTQLLLGGYAGQQQSHSALADAWSHSFYIGPSTGMEYTSIGLEEDEDFYAVVNLLGLSLGGEWANQDLKFSVRSDIFGDFAMVKPFATKDYHAQGLHFWGTKSVLWEGEYGYTWGHTFNLSAEASYRNLALGFKIKSQRWDSIDGKNRERQPGWNPNVRDVDFKDARDRYQVYLSYEVNQDISITAHHERIDRSGEIHGIDIPSIYSRLDDTEQRSWIEVVFHY
ncbi:DUF3943 domain-containing protein [Shewanella sp. Isolate11]|uniref:DUF3943 domain-containing protein n=1 Tax=Shewanella sp. Isolate11 TaxID=2908530 RepID=UPI001EFE860D|nr:DUF3943 domain-containing protein [Shewanella sp. Isolate11]MCG9697302.1 DUF3943 domain-containing protein [Shewanella sp. Isolate11]